MRMRIAASLAVMALVWWWALLLLLVRRWLLLLRMWWWFSWLLVLLVLLVWWGEGNCRYTNVLSLAGCEREARAREAASIEAPCVGEAVVADMVCVRDAVAVACVRDAASEAVVIDAAESPRTLGDEEEVVVGRVVSMRGSPRGCGGLRPGAPSPSSSSQLLPLSLCS